MTTKRKEERGVKGNSGRRKNAVKKKWGEKTGCRLKKSREKHKFNRIKRKKEWRKRKENK